MVYEAGKENEELYAASFYDLRGRIGEWSDRMQIQFYN